jgi:hypothetical protein
VTRHEYKFSFLSQPVCQSVSISDHSEYEIYQAHVYFYAFCYSFYLNSFYLAYLVSCAQETQQNTAKSFPPTSLVWITMHHCIVHKLTSWNSGWISAHNPVYFEVPLARMGIATDYWRDDWGVRVQVTVVSRIFPSPHHPDRLCGPPSFLSYGYRGLFPLGVRQQGHEANYSHTTNV